MYFTVGLYSHRQLKGEGFCHLGKSSLVLDQITFSKMTTFGAPFEITLYKEKNASVTTYALNLKPICNASLAPRMDYKKAGVATITVLPLTEKNICILIFSYTLKTKPVSECHPVFRNDAFNFSPEFFYFFLYYYYYYFTSHHIEIGGQTRKTE